MRKEHFRYILLLAALLVSVTRFAARSRTIWDWDEGQFCLSIFDFDIASGHPHPPGFPAYVACARIVFGFVHDPAAALRLLNVVAAIMIFPLFVCLGRAFGFTHGAALMAGTMIAFAPNIWFYGGTTYSDIPALAVTIASALFLYRSTEQPRCFVFACLCLSAALCIRPQTLLLVAWPLVRALLALRTTSRRTIMVGLLLCVVIVSTAYVLAAHAMGTQRYVEAVQKHSAYVLRVDSYRNPERPPVWRVAFAYLVAPHHALLAGALATSLALISVIRNKRLRTDVLLTFGPFILFASCMLDANSIDRFAVATVPLNLYLAADGARFWWRSQRVQMASQVLCCLLVTSLMIAHALPALRAAREGVAPPIAALLWARSHSSANTVIYADHSVRPFAEYLLPESMRRLLAPGTQPQAAARGSWYVSAGTGTGLHGRTFTADPILKRLTTHPQYATTIERADGIATFAAGWYDLEQSGNEQWRWAGPTAVLGFPAGSGPALLSITVRVPLELIHTQPKLSISAADAPPASITAKQDIVSFRCLFNATPNADTMITLHTDAVANPSAAGHSTDARALGFALLAYEWETSGFNTPSLRLQQGCTAY